MSRRLKFALIGKCNKTFKRKDVYLVGVFEMFFESASSVEVAEFPSFTAENEIGFGILVAGVEDRLNQADYFEGDFLFGCS